MGWEDDMIELGFTDGNDYLEHLMDDAEHMYQQLENDYRRIEENDTDYNLSPEEILELSLEKEKQKRQSRQKIEEKYQEELMEKSVIRQWAANNVEAARLWFARYFYYHRLSGSECEKLLAELRNTSSEDWRLQDMCDCDFRVWKNWVNKYDNYQRFKNDNPKEWIELKIDKYREYISMAAIWLMCYNCENINSPYYGSNSTKKATLNARKYINKWINDHKELWKTIEPNYKSVIKKDSEYYYQFWLETFGFRDAFAVWKIKNPSLWKQFQLRCNEGLVIDDDTLYREWVKTHKNKWDEWKNSHIEIWSHLVEYHKSYLWSVYTEVEWTKHLRGQNHKNRRFFSDEKYWYLENGDPRKIYKCENNRAEDKIHELIIADYNNELVENLPKKLFIQQHCSESDFCVFINKERDIAGSWGCIRTRLEELPDEYANRKLMELWIEQNKAQWQKWKYRFCWIKTYDKVCYSEKEYYEIWKRKHANKWEKWTKTYFKSWKINAQNLDLWYAWLSDDNEWAFHEWALINVKRWESLMYIGMEYDYCQAFTCLFDQLYYNEFDKWKENYPEEWKYWKEDLVEQILMIEFEREY